ncbi:hypothetical protein JHK85_007400 [Glycine max]|nr:hypothetical protein JHK85_007400 [Glycine max]
MSEESHSNVEAMDLLRQFEDILEFDALIDELGFIHPSQFALLKEESYISSNLSDEAIHQSADGVVISEESSKQDNLYFWNRDHKLGISTHVLLPLYRAAKHVFMTTLKQYRMCDNQSDKVGICLPASSSSCDHLESMLLRHSKSLLLLSCDFLTAWNCRRWVIKSISANCSNFNEILGKESELVEKIAEDSALLTIIVSIALQRLLLKFMENQNSVEETVSYGHNADIVQALKDELDWNETLIKRYVGREALWLHRRFLSMWILDSGDASYHSKEAISMHHDFGTFLQNELCLLHSCSTFVDDFVDVQAQAAYSACYILWLKVQIAKPLESKLLEKIKDVDLKTLLDKSCPERSSLFNYFMN